MTSSLKYSIERPGRGGGYSKSFIQGGSAGGPVGVLWGDIKNNGRTITNHLRWGDISQKNIPARETCLKKILQAVIRKKKFLAEEATCIAFKVIKSMG